MSAYRSAATVSSKTARRSRRVRHSSRLNLGVLKLLGSSRGSLKAGPAQGPGSDSFWLSCYNSGDACAREAPADAWGDRLSKQRHWVFASVRCDRFMVARLRYWRIRLGSDRPRRRRSHRGDAGRRRLLVLQRLPHHAQLRDGRQRAAIHLASRPAHLPGVLGLSRRHGVLLCASGVRSRTRHARRIPSRTGVAADLYRAQRVARHRPAEHPRAAGERTGPVHAERLALDARIPNSAATWRWRRWASLG